MKQLFFILIIINYCFVADCQQITPSVISSGSISKTYNKINYTHTIGELIIPSAKNNKILTQGFNQPVKVTTSKINKAGLNCSVSLYPNPVNDFLNIKINQTESNQNYRIEIYDLFGKLVFLPITKQNLSGITQISVNLQSLVQGQYFIKIISLNTNKFASFKVIKQ